MKARSPEHRDRWPIHCYIVLARFLTRIPDFQIAAFLLVFGLCNAEIIVSEIKVNDSGRVEHSVDTDIDTPRAGADRAEEGRESIEKDLPILPPIILLDFDNGTTSSDNATADEKSKRTVNNGLGYGFDRNSLSAPRKYNYYFPAGKTGTTVSIEESISPFLPRTIIEKVLPSNQNPVVPGSLANPRQQGSYGETAGLATSFRSQTSNYRYYDPATRAQSVFGLRTKLTKTSDSEPYGGFSPIARPATDAYSNVDYRSGAYASTTPQTLMFSPTDAASYVTPSSQSYTASSSARYAYITPSPQSYMAEVHSQRYLGQGGQHAVNAQGYSRPVQSAVEASTPNALDAAIYLESAGVQSGTSPHGYVRPSSNAVPSSASAEASGYVENAGLFAGLPKYTVENGVRYENKIFWKYPDGRVSDLPPMTYETYSEYPSLAASQAAKSQEASPIYESVATENSALSQGPVQFPQSPEAAGPPSLFISAESLSSVPQQQVYRLGYQNLVSQKQVVPQQTKSGSAVSPAYSTSPSPPRNFFRTNRKNQKSRYESSERPISRYMVNSPNPEYTDSYTTESTPLRSTTPTTSVFAQTGEPALHVLSRYTSRAHNYLRTVFPAGGSPVRKSNVPGKNLDSYSNLQYADLLNYNPSISQYIKNPASILNVRPTFVQAGSSLIPVIILRVDGVPPIQPKATPNVNLKALLQQYLIQYANSIEELARPSNYDLGNDQLAKDQNSFPTSPLRELVRLAQNNGQDLVGNPTESYIGKSSYETSNLETEKSLSSGKYGQRTAARPKVKSVQIIEDPRFRTYKDKNWIVHNRRQKVLNFRILFSDLIFSSIAFV